MPNCHRWLGVKHYCAWSLGVKHYGVWSLRQSRSLVGACAHSGQLVSFSPGILHSSCEVFEEVRSGPGEAEPASPLRLQMLFARAIQAKLSPSLSLSLCVCLSVVAPATSQHQIWHVFARLPCTSCGRSGKEGQRSDC